MVKIPATMAGLPAIEDCTAQGHVDQHHADLLARALQGGRRGVPARARAARRGRRRPVEGRVGRVVLRLARRHRGRQAPRGARQHEAAGQARDRERQARLSSTTSRRSPGRAGSSSRARARASSVPVGVDVDEEPGVPRRHLRRGADRPRDREHDAARDDRGVPGSRRGARRHGARRASTRRGSCSPSSRRRASTTTTSSTTLEAEGVQKFADAFDADRRQHPREARLAGGGMSEPVVERIWARDATVWTGDRRGAAGSAGSTSRRGCARTSTCCCSSPSPSSTAIDAVVLLGMGGSSLAPEVIRRTFGRRRSTFSTRRIRRRSASSRHDRHLAHALHLRVEVGLDARDPLAHRLLLGAEPGRRQLGRGHRSGLRARAAGARAGVRRGVLGRADDRRPLLGAVAVRDGAGGADGRRRRPAARPRAARWPRRAGSPRATPASSSGSRSARAGARAATRSASARLRRASASGPSSCSRSRPASRARVSSRRPASRPAGPTGRRRRCA